MKTILLYGHLARKFGRVHKYAVSSPAEAIQALCATLKGFRQAVIEGGRYRFLVGGRDALDASRLQDPTSDKDTLRLVPVIAGAKEKGGIWQTILGVVLVAVDYVFFDGATGLANVGWAMILGGVSQMLFAPPKTAQTDRPENRPSYAFDGAVNTAAQGNPVPICYGRVIVGSQVVSAGLSVEQVL